MTGLPAQSVETGAPRRARMARYALWQARDYCFERGLPTIIVAGLFGFLGAVLLEQRALLGGAELSLRQLRSAEMLTRIPQELIDQYGSAEVAQQLLLRSASTTFLRGFLGSIVFLGALFAMNGLVSNDRKNGYYKFLFAKPVTPERYYGQAFLVHALGFLAVIVILMQLWGVFVVPVLGVDLIAAMFLVYLCYAGIAFLLTAAARWDWLSLVAVALASTVLWSRYESSASPFARLLYLLPPLPRVDSVYAAATQRVPLPWDTLAWLAGYGIACFVAALVVLRHRRLATP